MEKTCKKLCKSLKNAIVAKTMYESYYTNAILMQKACVKGLVNFKNKCRICTAAKYMIYGIKS